MLNRRLSAVLLSRLVAAFGASVASCGSSGSSNVDHSTPSGNAGNAGAGGGQAGGNGGASNAGASATGGAAGAGASAGSGAGGLASAGAGGSSGASAGGAGGGGAVFVCDPTSGKGNDGAPPLHCQPTGPVGPQPGCSTTIGMGGPLSCYVPGAASSPPATCLTSGDATLAKLLEQGCGGVIDKITSGPECRIADTTGQPATLSCCYSVTFTATCQARPFLIADRHRLAAAVRRADWHVARLS